MVETGRIIEWIKKLVKIPSVGPANAGSRSGRTNEALIAAQLATWFEQLGFKVYLEDVFPSRPNVYAIQRGTSDRWLAIDVHSDTVGVENMVGDPFDGRLHEGRVYGRGAVDTKASLGVILAILESLHQVGKRLEANLLICASADEETGAQGAAAFARWVRQQQIRLDQLLVAEPTLCGPVYAHAGSVGLKLEVQGVSAHSSRAELGKNAIVAAAPLILALAAEHERLQSVPPRTAPTLTVSVINGGQAINVVPDKCCLLIDRRVVVGEDPAQVAVDLYKYAKKHCPLPLSMRTTHELPAFYQSPDSLWIRQLADWSGVQPFVAPYGTNAWAYCGLAHECVVLAGC